MSVCENKVHDYILIKLRADWAQTHHLYYGIFLVLASVFNLDSNSLVIFATNWVVFWLGVYLIADDLWQHWMQVEHDNPCYHSPVHRFIYDYLKLYNREWYRKLNDLLDKLFRKT